ncbi:MAG TPA: ABC transporter ATP-binding protein [Planctomycetota bacterium]|nr:ABC transporter ATP-binding protein [Planctomycetota bacterium]
MRFILRSISYFRRDAKLILLLVAMIAGSVGLNLLHAWPMAIMIDAVLAQTPRTTWIHTLFLSPFGTNKIAQVLGIAGIGMLIKILQDTLWMLRMMLNNRIKYNGITRVRTQLYERLQDLSLGWHRSRTQGDSIYRLASDSMGPWGILDTLIGACTAAVTLTAMILIMLSRNVALTVFALSITPLLVVANIHFGKKIRRRAAESKRQDAAMTTSIQRSMASMGLIQAFGRQRSEALRFKGTVDRSVGAAMRLNWQEQLYPLAVQVIFALGGAVIFGYGGYLVYQDQFVNSVKNGLTCGDLMVFMVYLGQLWDPLGLVIGFGAKIQTHAAACERVFEVLDEKTEIADAPGAIPLSLRPRTLWLENVNFAYQAGVPVLKNISARIEPGRMVAFLGPSGTGKSTLLNLLPRFYDPQEGSLRLDDHDLRSIKVADVRRHMALVMQDSPLFPGTVAENIAYGNDDASELEIQAAAMDAGAAEFIEALPDGYETEITEGGQNLSGGQRQRLAIARALLTQAPILILDEPTSALDLKHEQWVIETLQRLKGKRTIILVTHRLETATQCDWIYVMQAGTIAEQGSHQQLLARQGLYASMLRRQENAGAEGSTDVDDLALTS